MLRGFLFASVFTCLVTPAFAADCVEPYAPAIANGTTATKDQMLTTQDEVKAFIKASDNYQECVLLDIQTQKAALAREQKTLNQDVIDRATAQIDRNQREKERVGTEYNVAVRAYAAAHPNP